ncbi:MAG: zinc-dependent metalloprotease, partial [Propionibacteriaceae bacterium]|nr:zinc-dependent metalloprotease [Propionibacteriaceae bacterium]
LGLQIRPKRLREAQAFWASLTAERGVAGRDDTWTHPDHLPTAAELGDPTAFLAKAHAPWTEDSFDAELRRLLDGEAPTAQAG